MYLIELIAKFVNKKNCKRKVNFEIPQEEIEDYENCEHLYMVIDSTKRYLACSKCGNIIKNPAIKKKKNFFIK